jgi:hypothetical protein
VETVATQSGSRERWYYWEGDKIKHHLVMKNGVVVYYYKMPEGR